ncbi:MAG TPA: hypothetical protein VMS64_01945 [Candidatus Methylomirabilis sp.]|nr:hypothetical protein [Candidatus Methylomirabilis sp.]
MNILISFLPFLVFFALYLQVGSFAFPMRAVSAVAGDHRSESLCLRLQRGRGAGLGA